MEEKKLTFLLKEKILYRKNVPDLGSLSHFSLINSFVCSLPGASLLIKFLKGHQPHPGLMPPTLFSQQLAFSYCEDMLVFFFCLPLFFLKSPVSFSLSSLYWSMHSTFPDTLDNDFAGEKTGVLAGWGLLFILSGSAPASSQ